MHVSDDGTTAATRDDVIPSVFEVDTTANGSFWGVRWRIDGTWVSSSHSTGPYAVPLTHDVYHDDAGMTEGTS